MENSARPIVARSRVTSARESENPARRVIFSGSQESLADASFALLKVRVVNAFSPEDGVAHRLSVADVKGRQLYEAEINADIAAASSHHIPLASDAGVHLVRIGSLHCRSKKSISRMLYLRRNESALMDISLSRKQSLLSDIWMSFEISLANISEALDIGYEWGAMREVAGYRDYIESEARAQGVDEALIKSVIYAESARRWDNPVFSFHLGQPTVRPLHVPVELAVAMGFDKDELGRPEYNIKAGIALLKAIADRAVPATPAVIATLYKRSDAVEVSEYGRWVESIYRRRLWEPAPGVSDKYRAELLNYNRLTSAEQVALLKRIFVGG